MSSRPSEYPKSSTRSLCNICEAIPFNAENPPFGNRPTTGEWLLGTLDQIEKKTYCPFCRLVILAVYEARRGWTRMLVDEVVLNWQGGMGSGGGFIIRGMSGIGTMICFVNESAHPISMPRVRSFLPLVGPLDLKRARRWISVCEKDHGNLCNPQWSQITHIPSAGPIIPGLEVLRLIDVADGCLVEFQNPCRYLTLSYVWGGVPNFRLTTGNKSSLMQPGVLQKNWAKLPSTIQDAVDIVKVLNERFLWIDVLCLVQNDGTDMRSGIEVMDLIYERSVLSIIAASGDSANAGLPGVRAGSRFITNHVERIQPGIKLAIYNELDHLLRPSTYSRRAWTFQEQLLSRRALYFTDDQVYFRCRECTWSENCVDQLSTPNNDSFHGTLLQSAWDMDSREVAYRTMLFYYTKRVLSDQADALLAMAGIIRRLSDKMMCRFFQGIPTAVWDSFMVFIAHTASNSLLRRRHGFPSYSWTGWIGGIDFFDPEDENNWLSYRTWIIWYKRSPSGTINLVWDIMANESFPISNLDFVSYRQRYPFGNRHVLPFSTSRTAPTEHRDFEREFPEYPILQFWTLAVYFTISDFSVFIAEAYIFDRQGTRCGWTCMDGFEDSTFFETKGPLEFIVLSETNVEPRTNYDGGLTLSGLSYPVDSKPNAWKYYYVLLLEWNGGMAERRGVGVIFQKAVEKSFSPGPTWKEIFMA